MTRVITTLCLIVGFSVAYAGGWTQGEGNYYAKIYQTFVNGSQHFNNTSNITSDYTFNYYATTFYGEYGIAQHGDIVVNFPAFVHTNYEILETDGLPDTVKVTDAINGVGNLTFGPKIRFVGDRKVEVAGTFLFGIPSSRKIRGGGDNTILETGTFDFNQLIRIDASSAIRRRPKVDFYYGLYAGFNNRSNNYSEEVLFGGEIDAALLKNRLYVIFKIDGVMSLENGSRPVSDFGVFSNNTSYISPSVEVSYKITEKFGVSFSTAGALYAKNVVAAPYVNIGIFVDK